MGDILFYGFGGVTVLSALVVAFSPKIMHAAFSLLVALSGVAVLYIFLGADFLAATQLLVYVGGILILVLFGVLMTHNIGAVTVNLNTGQIVLGTLTSLLVLGSLGLILYRNVWFRHSDLPFEPTAYSIGESLMTTHLLPFELASVLLLAAMIGAVMIARKEG